MPKHLAVKDTDSGLNLALPALEPLVYSSLARLRLPLCKRGHLSVVFLPGSAGGPIPTAFWSGCCMEYWASERCCPRARIIDMSAHPAASSQTFTIFFCVKRPHHTTCMPTHMTAMCAKNAQTVSGQRNSQAHRCSQSKHPGA